MMSLNVLTDLEAVRRAIHTMEEIEEDAPAVLQAANTSGLDAAVTQMREEGDAFDGAVIAGFHGRYRYLLRRNGNVLFSRHRGAEGVEKAVGLGFDIG